MLSVEKLDPTNKTQVREFINLPYRLYKNHPQWVPALFVDAEMQLNQTKHPFYEHSEAEFYVARNDGTVVGRLGILENKPFNKYHETRQAQFYLFETEDDFEITKALFTRGFERARERGMDRIVGPKGFGALDGYGLLVEGYDHRQIMTMMNYNYPYYPQHIEALGFTKEVDFVSCYLERNMFNLPDRIHSIADRVVKRGKLSVVRFNNKKDLRNWAPKIGKAYNQAFVNNWEYYPLSAREINFILENILMIADPRLIKIIVHGEDVVGFLLGFPDLSAGLQRAQGRILPMGILHILGEMRRTNWLAMNGMGILPEFQGYGGNALLYVEMENTVKDNPRYKYVDMTQVAETAVQMRHDLINLGGKAYKNHRVYQRSL